MWQNHKLTGWHPVSSLLCVCLSQQGLTREYDRLLAEHDKLQRQLARAGGGGGGGGYSDKKSA